MKTIKQYKEQGNELKRENDKIKYDTNELQHKYAALKELDENCITEKFSIQYLEKYLHNKDGTVKIAMELSQDIIRFLIHPNNSPPPPNKYATTMRHTVVMMTKTYSELFLDLARKLSILEMTDFEMLEGVANELLRVGETNCGRIVALYAFGASVAQYAEKTQMHSVTIYVENYVGKYVAKHLNNWIVQKGGWDDFEMFFAKMDSKTFEWKPLFVIAVGLGALIGLGSVRGSY